MGKVWLLVFGIFLLNSGFILCDDDPADAEEDELDLNEIAEENDVLILTDANFQNAIADNEIILVEFYAPWCGHCKSLAPEFEKAAGILKENDPKVTLAKVDATVEKDLASDYLKNATDYPIRKVVLSGHAEDYHGPEYTHGQIIYGVSGFPTLIFFKNGAKTAYDGPRTSDGIVSYMKERADPSWKPPPDLVLHLTKANFSEFVDTAELILVEFYAPWCGHCKQLAPVLEKAAQGLQAFDPVIPIYKVDCPKESDLAREYEIKSYPTLKVFRRGKVFDYTGTERTAHAIVSYMENERRPPSTEVTSLSAVKKFMKTDDVTVFAFFKANDAAFETYENAANELRSDYDLGHTFDREAMTFYKVNAPSIAVFTAENFHTKHEQKYHVMPITKDSSVEEIRAFIAEHSIPLVGEYKTSNRATRYRGKYPLLIMFYSVDWSHDGITATQLWRRKLADIAKDHRDMTFAIANEDDHAELLKGFGFEDSGEEINIGILNELANKMPQEESKFPMPTFDSFDSDEIREFISNYKAGKISRKYKSQPVPKKSKVAVKTVVGSTFEKIVGDKSKDVVIEFMFSGCSKCKEFAPKYTALAKQYAKFQKNLVFAKIDNTLNEFPEAFLVDTFPSFYMVPANGDLSSPAKFSKEEELTPENLMKFVKENAKASFADGKDEL